MPKVAQPLADRKRDFRVALAMAGQTQKQWCERRGIVPPHLSMILSGVRSNAKIERQVDRFIERQFSQQKALAS